MPYRLDDMGDERFQQLCQAILVREEPTLRCYPLGQTDGGRDSARNASRDGRGRLVHQVKWTRHPDRVRNPVGWLTSAINGEADNIRRLVDEGLERYMLITNISGTAAPGSGTIDRLDKELDKLSEHYRVPIQCWWKDDLERRLDSAPTSLKLTYSEILVGIDAYRALIAGELKGDRANQIGALLRRVSAAQWDTDAVVRFKQVEMDAADLDTLFVDVPARSLSRSTERDQFAGRRLPDLTPTGTATVAATTLLIGSPAAKVVILGAPGQGKSTLLQYACQTYRATLLGKQRQLGNQQTRDDRFPLRTELRDYALWVEGKDPFEEPTSGDYRRRPRGSRPSLESYLARQLSHQSGGDEVDLDTVREVFDRYPVLLALDGLDEVASAEVRRTVVQEIEAATARLWQGACKPLVVITARPSFSNLPEPSRQEFDYHELTSLTDQLRRDYLRKWTKAQRLDTRDARELVRVFNARSTDSHVRELAENPMQLAILLFLIHQRGESVPTHRTQLFSDYMGKFLDREAAKTPAVAQYRDLLEDVTRFLGWYLHSTAESAASNGRATLKKLKREMSHYLVDQGKSPDLVDVLFTAVTEKVWALTSRVQTSFEFEVQSVREYFAAEHLVQSAPVSRTSSLPDKFDRFRALAVRPYWMNTVRFMAGLFSPGELAGLRDVLDEAREDDPDRFWMRRVAMVLLADGVFDPKPKVRRQLIHSTFDDAGQRILLHDIGSGEAQPLNPDHGREDLTQLLQQLITADPRSALTSERALLLARHMARDDALSWWREMLAADGPNALDAWLGVGVPLRVGQGLASDALDELSQRDVEAPTLLLAAGANPASGSPAEEAMVAAVLDGRGHGAPWPSLAADLFHALHPARFVSMLPPLVRTSDSGRSEIVLSDASTAHLGLKVADDHAVKAAVGRLRRKDDLAPIIRAMREGRGQKGTVSVWVNVARAVNARFGPTWLANEIAIIGASSPNLRPGGDVNSTAPPFGVGSDVGILVREIRSNASKTSWWRQETASLTTEIDVATWALALASVAAEETVEACVSLLGELLSQLSDTRVGALLLSAARLGMSTAARKISSDIVVAASAASERAASLLTPYISLVAHFDISERIDPPTLVAMAKHGPASWAVTWPVVQAYRGDLKEQDILRAAGASAYVPDEAIPPAADKEPDWSAPLADPATYPWNFIEAIDRLLEGQRELPSLLSESTRDNWFEEED